MEKISILIADDHKLVRQTWGLVVNYKNTIAFAIGVNRIIPKAVLLGNIIKGKQDLMWDKKIYRKLI